MKSKILIIVSLIFFVVLSNLVLYSQDACGSNAKITTNPDNPINENDTEPPSRLNNFFDWRV